MFSRDNTSQPKSKTREWVESIVFALILALLIRAFVVQAFKIPSGSMKNTLLIGDHILVNKFIYGIKIPIIDRELVHFKDPERRDIVVFTYPLDPSKDFIKRVIGVPGDRLRIEDKVVFVNNEPQLEPYTRFTDPNIRPGHVSPRDNLDTITVPPDSLFVMGDNRDESYDSRFWRFVRLPAIKGKAFVIYFSWNQQGNLSLDSDIGMVRWKRIGNLIE